jgi:hypothetical protein
MTSKIKKIYKSGLKNDKFLQAIKEADGDKKPNLFSGDLEKHLFASVYYGWLVREYGIAWELNL